MSTSSPVVASRPLFASRAPSSLTESPSHKERSLFLHSSADATHPPAHASPQASPRSLTRQAALTARRNSSDLLTHPTPPSSSLAQAPAPKPNHPFVLQSDKDAGIDSDMSAEKSEDGRTVLLGEGKIEGSNRSLIITATEPAAQPPADLTRVSSLSAASKGIDGADSAATGDSRAVFHPGVRKDSMDDKDEEGSASSKEGVHSSLLTTKDPLVGAIVPPAEPDKLTAPPQKLDAPLDTMRPDVESSMASIGAASVPLRSDQKNVLDVWSTLRSQLQGKQLVVFLDYDGTLTPIVSEPQNAIINETQRARLAKLATKCPVSIVTGRTVSTIQQFILGSQAEPKPQLPGLDKLYFAGSHGFDIRCPPSSSHSDKQVADEFLPQLNAFYQHCVDGCKDIPGAMVENNKYSISVHYRNVSSASDVSRIDSIVSAAIRPFELSGQLQRFAGKCVHEIRPRIDWHKGAAVHYLLDLIFPSLLRAEGSESGAQALRLPDGRELCPIYFGDDTTDEDAFKLLRKFDAASGAASAAGAGASPTPTTLSVFVRSDSACRPSAANFVLRSPEEVGRMLDLLADIAQ